MFPSFISNSAAHPCFPRSYRILLHLHVSLVHIEFCAAPQPRKALRVTIMVMVLACSWPWHVYQIEIHIAPARRSIPLEVNVHTERLARKVGHVEVLCIAVVCGRI